MLGIKTEMNRTAKDEPWEQGFCDTGEVRLHYVTQGAGELVLLLHGFPEFWYSWRHQITALAIHFRVIVPDLRGYNKSDKPKGVAQYSLNRILQDIKGLIEACGDEKVILIGHDWGGGIAYTLAARYPETVERLIVLNCPHPTALLKHLRSNPKQILRSWYMLFFQIPGLPEALIRLNRRFFVRRTFQGMAIHKEAFSEEDLACFERALANPGATTSAINYYRAAFRQWAKGELRPLEMIRCPTLLIWGEKDTALGKELTYDMAQYFTGRLQVKYLPDCSHWVQQDCPARVNTMILEFLVGA